VHGRFLGWGANGSLVGFREFGFTGLSENKMKCMVGMVHSDHQVEKGKGMSSIKGITIGEHLLQGTKPTSRKSSEIRTTRGKGTSR
jgi:hypothetical protein